MKTSSLKNIVILILALANAFLLLLLLSRHAEQRAAYENSVKQLTELFSESGVSFDGKALPRKKTLVSAVPLRDLDAEKKFAETVLGSVDTIDSGGGIYRCESSRGFCQFRANGSVEAVVKLDGLNPASCCAGILETYGYSVTENTCADAPEGSGRLVGCRLLGDCTVFNATLTFQWEKGKELIVSGLFLPTVQEQEELTLPDVVTPLVRLHDYRIASGDVFREICAMECGCYLQSTAVSPLRLVPMWRIRTDVYTYLVNPETGVVSRVQ